MEFLSSITINEMKASCFEETIEILCDGDVVGKWSISLRGTKSWNLFEFTSDLHIRNDGGIGGTEIHAVVTGTLKTIMQEKYEYCKVDNFLLEKWTKLTRKTGGSYDVSYVTVKNNMKCEYNATFCCSNMQGFIAEASGLILQRVIACRCSVDIIILRALDQNYNLCSVTFTPLGTRLIPFHKVEYKVFCVQAELRSKENEILLWTSYYHTEGFLMFYNQDCCPLYCLIPKQSPKVDSKFYMNLQEKHGIRYLYTIGEEELDKIIFCETSETHLGNNSGIFNVSVKQSHFSGERCLLIHIHMSVILKDSFISSSITSYLNFHLETLEYLEHDLIERNKMQKHKILLIYHKEDSVNVDEINLNKKVVSRKMFKYSKRQFDDFISKASCVILQRLLVLRGLDQNLSFVTLWDGTKLSKLIFRPLINESSISMNSACTFGIEYAVIPETGKISVWKNYFYPNGRLMSGFEWGYPLRFDHTSISLLPKYEVDNVIGMFRSLELFENGSEFLQSIDVGDILLVLFDEKLKVLTNDGIEIGHFVIHIEDHLNEEFKHIIVHLNLVKHFEGVTTRTSIKGKLSASLDTIEQSVEENVSDNWENLSHKKILIQKTCSKYSLTETITISESSSVQEIVIDSYNDLCFVSETASILLERLIVRKKVCQSLKFFTLNTDLSACVVSYHILPKRWCTIDKMKCEVFCVERNVSFPEKLAKEENPPILQWKLCFSQTGHCIERTETNQPLKIVPNILLTDDADSFPLFPIDTMHDPPFDTHIDLSEMQSLLFDDDLVIVSSNGDEIGNYSVSVDHVKYKGEDSLFLHIHLLSKIEDDFCGSIATAYLSLNLEILDFRKTDFLQNQGKKMEKSISFTKVNNSYVVQCMKTDGSVVSRDLKNWCLPQQKFYVCEASSILIQRLMVLRKTEEMLDFITFDMSGNAHQIEFVPKGLKFLNACEQQFDVVSICSNIDFNGEPLVSHESLFTRSGFAISHTQENINGKIIHFCLQKNEKINQSMNELCMKQSFSPTFSRIASNVTPDPLHSVGSHALEDILTDEKLCIMSDQHIKVGSLSFVAKYVHYKGKHCLLVKLNVVTNIENAELVTTTIDLLRPNMQLLKHRHTCLFKTDKFSAEKRISLEERGATLSLKQLLKYNGRPEILINAMISQNTRGFVSEASCLLFQKILVKKNLSGQYRFITIDINRNLCNVVLRTLGYKMENIDGQDMRVFGIDVEITPFRKCSCSWRSYFDQNGALLLCKPNGLPLLLTRIHYNAGSILHPNQLDYSVLQEQIHFLNSLEPKDFDFAVRSEYAHIIYKGRVLLGDFVVFTDSIHYKGQHCIYAFMSSFIEAAGKTCSTNACAILSSKLEVQQYILHEYTSPCKDAKILITLEDGIYNIERLCIESENIYKKEFSVPSHEFPVVCCEAIGIIVVYLIVHKRIGYTLEFKSVDKDGNLCQTSYHNLGIRNIKVSGVQMRAWKILNKTTYKDGRVMTWEYNMTEDGYLLCRQQVGVPVMIIVQREEK